MGMENLKFGCILDAVECCHKTNTVEKESSALAERIMIVRIVFKNPDCKVSDFPFAMSNL